MLTSENILGMWRTGRSTFDRLLDGITEEQLALRMHPESNSIGFLIRHIAEAEHSFAMAFFGTEVKFDRLTLGPVKDTGQFTHLQDLKDFVHQAEGILTKAIEHTSPEQWETVVEARMGTLSRRDAIARLIAHTAYHAGQIGMIRKYGV